LYQTLANIATENSTILFPFPEEVCLEEGKQNKKTKKRKRKDNTGTIIP
jgi:hypothetical protein